MGYTTGDCRIFADKFQREWTGKGGFANPVCRTYTNNLYLSTSSNGQVDELVRSFIYHLRSCILRHLECSKLHHKYDIFSNISSRPSNSSILINNLNI